MKVIGRRTKLRKHESVIIHYDVYNSDTISEENLYTIPNISNPYIVVNVRSNYYNNDNFYSLNIWIPAEKGAKACFNVGLPTWITKHWEEQQYMLSINVVGGNSTISTMQGIFKSLYKDDWRFDEDEIPTDFDTLYTMIEFKDASLLKGISNKPICNMSYNEPLATNRTILVD